MNRQEQLDFINQKIARTWWGTSVWETGYYLPVMIGDTLDFWEKQIKGFYSQPVYQTIIIWPSISEKIIKLWKTKREPLDSQDDECISYIYSLLQ